MPPKPKRTRDEIAIAAYGLIQQEGSEELSARKLGKVLNVSASSIFTVFSNMEEVKMAARELALNEFKETIGNFCKDPPIYKQIGTKIVSYGIREPEKFKLIFMQEPMSRFSDSVIKEYRNVCVDRIGQDYDITRETAGLLFEQLLIHAYALGSLCAFRAIRLDDEETESRLNMIFEGIILFIKSGKVNELNGKETVCNEMEKPFGIGKNQEKQNASAQAGRKSC